MNATQSRKETRFRPKFDGRYANVLSTTFFLRCSILRWERERTKIKKKKERKKEIGEKETRENFSILPVGFLFLFRKKPEHTVMHHKIYTIYRFVFVQII